MRPIPAGKLSQMAQAALMAAVTCVLAPLAIPIGPVPISLTTLAVYFSLYLLGGRWGTVSCLVYVLLGTAGLPVFSGFTGGLGKLAGPTGGYIIGFLPMALLAGWAIGRFQSRWLHLAGMAAGTAVCYAFGTLWFCFVSGSAPLAALSLCVFPFIPGDLAKMAAALLLGPAIRRRLTQTGLVDRV